MKLHKIHDFKGWKNICDSSIEFSFDDRDVFNEVLDTMEKKFPLKLKTLHWGWDEKSMVLCICTKKALKYLIRKYGLLRG